MEARTLFWTAAALAIGSFALGETAAPPAPAIPREVAVDLDNAARVPIPEAFNSDSAGHYATPDGRDVWVARVSSAQLIPTPAVWQGRVIVSAGFSSSETCAYDAATGRPLWRNHNPDGGATAVAVEDGYLCYSTESCDLCVARADTGELLWHQWIGDPLLSQPAIWKGRVYAAAPGDGYHRTSSRMGMRRRWHGGSYRLWCADLKTGATRWTRDIADEVISAPVVEEGNIYLACVDGTSLCLDAESGRVAWQRKVDGASAPLVTRVGILQARMIFGAPGACDVVLLDAKTGACRKEHPLTAVRTPRMDADPWVDAVVPPAYRAATAVKTPAPDPLAKERFVNPAGTRCAWGYEGPRPATSGVRAFTAQGNAITCIDISDGATLWHATATGGGDDGKRTFSPPALGRERVYLCSMSGRLLALDRYTGEVVFDYDLGHPMSNQPVLSGGRVFVGTTDGLLISVDTGSADADGWTCWGGNARHNKTD